MAWCTSLSASSVAIHFAENGLTTGVAARNRHFRDGYPATRRACAVHEFRGSLRPGGRRGTLRSKQVATVSAFLTVGFSYAHPKSSTRAILVTDERICQEEPAVRKALTAATSSRALTPSPRARRLPQAARGLLPPPAPRAG